MLPSSIAHRYFRNKIPAFLLRFHVGRSDKERRRVEIVEQLNDYDSRNERSTWKKSKKVDDGGRPAGESIGQNGPDV